MPVRRRRNRTPALPTMTTKTTMPTPGRPRREARRGDDPLLHEPTTTDSREPPPRSRLRAVVDTLRPHQWVKNSFVVAPLVFAKHLFDWTYAGQSAAAFAAF